MTAGVRAGAGSAGGAGPPLHRQEVLRRVARLRCAAEHLATAEFLERRAGRAATPALACLLRERAAERRRRGERLLAGLRGEAVQVERL